MRGIVSLFVAMGLVLGGCPREEALDVVQQAVDDPTNYSSVGFDDAGNQVGVEFYHPTVVRFDPVTGRPTEIIGGNGDGDVTVNVDAGGGNSNANGNSNGNTNGNANGNNNDNSNSSANRIKITGVRIVSGPPDGQNWYTGDPVIFEVTTDGDGEIHFSPPDARIAADFMTENGRVQITYRFLSPTGVDREPALVRFWPQDRNTEYVSLGIVVRQRVAQ